MANDAPDPEVAAAAALSSVNRLLDSVKSFEKGRRGSNILRSMFSVAPTEAETATAAVSEAEEIVRPIRSKSLSTTPNF